MILLTILTTLFEYVRQHISRLGEKLKLVNYWTVQTINNITRYNFVSQIT